MKLALKGVLGAAAVVAALGWWAVAPTGSGAATAVIVTAPSAAAAAWPPAGTAAVSALPEARSGAAPLAAEPAQAALPMVPVTLAGPERLRVGEQAELTIAVGGSASVGEVVVTLRFDPNVLQARAGTPGAWATGDGADTRFSVEITEAGDQVLLRSAPASRQLSAAGGAVALVQFEAVGPGATAVALAEVTVADPSGRALPVLLSMAKLQVTAEAAP